MTSRIRHDTKPATEETYTIWDNLKIHSDELRALGATEEMLAELRAAAQAVQDAEEAEASTAAPTQVLAEVLAPVQVLGWTVNPPTTAARYYAQHAMRQVMAGPDATAALHAIVAGLHVLAMYGQGRKAEGMRLALDAGAIADWLAATLPSLDLSAEGDLCTVWLRLMGLPTTPPPEQKKTMATKAYLQKVENLRLYLGARTPTSSPQGSPHAKA